MSAMVGPRPNFFFFQLLSRDKTGKIFCCCQLSPRRKAFSGRQAPTYIQTSHVRICTFTLYMQYIHTHKQRLPSPSLSVSRVRTAVLAEPFFPCVHGPFFLGGVGIISLSSFQNTIKSPPRKRTHVAKYARPPPPTDLNFFSFDRWKWSCTCPQFTPYLSKVACARLPTLHLYALALCLNIVFFKILWRI